MSLGSGLNHGHVTLIFLSVLDSSVGNSWSNGKEFVLEFSVIVGDDLLLFLGEGKKRRFFLSRKSLEFLKSHSHLGLNHWQDLVVAIGHESSSDTVEGRLERGSLDFSSSFSALNLGENRIDGADGDFSHVGLEVRLLEVLDGVKHGEGSSVEVSLRVQLGVGQEVDESSLLNEFVLLVDSVVLELLLGVLESDVLGHLAAVGPHVSKLLILVVGVGIVKDGELWTNNHGVMSQFDQTNIVGDKELMMPDHCSEPVVVLPSAES